jgi:hypothetical protein
MLTEAAGLAVRAAISPTALLPAAVRGSPVAAGLIVAIDGLAGLLQKG